MKDKKTSGQDSSTDSVQAPVPEKKRMALIHYLTILFAVAFILVLISLVTQSARSSDKENTLQAANSSAFRRVEALQEQVQKKEAEKEALQLELDAIKEQNGLSGEQTVELRRQVQSDAQKAYDAAILLLFSELDPQSAEYKTAKQTVKTLWDYLSPETQQNVSAVIAEQ